MMRQQKIKMRRWFSLVLVIAAIVGTVWYIRSDFAFDRRTVKKSEEKDYQKQVQENADKSQFKVRINSRIELDTPDSEALLYIRNPEENQYDTYVELISDVSGKTVYTSDKLKPGDSAETGYLKGVTGAGEQPYTAYFHIVEKGKEISSIEYAVTVVVKES